MKTALKAARAALALALILLSPGLEPYAAAAGEFSAGARVSPAAVAAPAAMPGLGAAALPPSALSLFPNLTAAGVNTGVSLSGPAAPGAAIPSVAAEPAAAPEIPAHSAPNVGHTPAHSTWNVPATAPAAAATSAQGQLSLGARQVTAAAAPSSSVESGAAALDGVFSGSAKLEAADAAGPVSAGAQRSLGGVLGRSEGRSGGETRGEEPQSPQAPRQSLGRSARVGLIAAIVPIAITMATMAVATALGYHFHAGYQAPFPQHMTAVTAVTSLVAAAFMAPVSEEMIFRGGIMGWLTKHTPESFGPMLRFAIPAVLSSLVFVAVHELSDPVLFATRFVHSMILSYAFHKEGYTGSMFAHGFFNGLLFMPALLGILLPGVAGTVAAMALTPLTLWLGYKAARRIWAERADKKSGRLVAYQVSPLAALLLAAALMAGYFFIMPNIVWPVGAIGWLGYAIRRWKAGRR